MNPLSLATLRKQLRQQRRAIHHRQQQQTAEKMRYYAQMHPKVISAQKIGIYLHAFGEVQTHRLMAWCFKLGKRVFVPQVCAMNQRLAWVELTRHHLRQGRLVRHRLNMQEVRSSRGHDVRCLDVLFVPLLACDVRGVRLGMGGGFYDRTLALAPQLPYRIGLAHQFQYLTEPLTRQAWDETLDELWTPQQRYTFKRHLRVK